MTRFPRSLAFALMTLGLLAAMSRVSGAPMTFYPLDHSVENAYRSGEVQEAAKTYSSNGTWKFIYEDKLAAASAFFDLGDFPAALAIINEIRLIRNSPVVAAYTIFLSSLSGNFAELEREFPSSPIQRIRLLKALALIHVAEYGAAEKLLDPLPTDINDCRQFRIALAEIAVSQRDYGRAYATLSKAIEASPSFAPLYLLRAQILVENGGFDLQGAALDDLSAAEAGGANPLPVAICRGKVYINLFQYDVAEAEFSKGIALSPNDATSYRYRGDCRRILNRKPEAIEDYKRAYELDPSMTVAVVNIAVLSVETGQYAIAGQLFDEAVANDPKCQSAFVERGNFRAVMGDIDGAIDDFVNAAEITPKDPYPLIRAARVELEHTNAEKARSYALEALERRPEDSGALTILGEVAFISGDYDSSSDFFRRSSESDSNNVDAWRGLARSRLEVRDIRGARDAAMRAVSKWPDDVASLYVLGMSYVAAGERDKADGVFSLMISKDVGYGPAYFGLALVDMGRGQVGSAVAELDAALNWRPTPEYALFRAQIGAVEPSFKLGDEKLVSEQLSGPAERLRLLLINCAFSRDIAPIKAAAQEARESPDPWLSYMAKLILEQRDA
ncbi:MAG: tetratricopeptide repeat protein, partial [Candidatus Brocadiia bacterium]